MNGRPTFHMFGLDGNQDTKKTLMTPEQSSELAREYDMQKRFGEVNWDSVYNQTQQSPVKSNQNRMRQWAGGPVKQQNKQMKNAVVNSHVTEPAFDDPYPDPRDLVRQGRVQNKSNLTNDTAAYSDYGAKTRVNRLATPLRALPMVAPEALGMIGAAQEAQQRGVNPMVNWLQRMTPAPVVAPTGNGGEVYNYQSGERYTPMY